MHIQTRLRPTLPARTIGHMKATDATTFTLSAAVRHNMLNVKVLRQYTIALQRGDCQTKHDKSIIRSTERLAALLRLPA